MGDKTDKHDDEKVLQRKQRVEGIVHRDTFRATDTDGERINVSIVDEEKRVVRLSFSSEEPYLRQTWWDDPWIEVLGHKDEEVDLFRFANRATVHYNHSRRREDRIGVVLEASIKDGRGEALIQISDRADVEDVWNDLKKGLLCNVSVGYKIHEKVLTKQNDDGPNEYRVILWEPVELSIVDIPADPTVGVGRGDGVETNYRVLDIETAPDDSGQRKESEMGDETTQKETPADDTTREDGDVVTKDEAKKQVSDAERAALKAEDDRKRELRTIFDGHTATAGVEDLLRTCIDDSSIDVDTARKRLLKVLGDSTAQIGGGQVQAGSDEADKFRDGVIIAIEARAGVKGVTVEDDNPWRGLTLVEIARAALEINNLDSSGGRMDVVGRAFTMRSSAIGHTPSDFANILQNVANKAVLRGFDEAQESWQKWCQVGNLSDFKQAHRVQLSSFDDLDLIGPGGEYKYGTFSDRGETIQLGTYGKIFAITRQAIINDDMQILSSVPSKMGRAAARVPGDLAYAVLTTNPVMSDGNALFSGAHNNEGTAGAPSVVLIDEAGRLMALQSDVSGNATNLNITLGAVLVPRTLLGTAQVVRTSEFDPASTTNSRAPNHVRNTFEVVWDARLDTDSTTRWYGVADKSHDTVEVAFLDGVQEPTTEEKQGWNIDGAEFKVRLDCAAAAMEWRSFTRNQG